MGSVDRVHTVSVFVSNCQYFWVQCQSKILSLKMSVFVSILSGKLEFVSIFPWRLEIKVIYNRVKEIILHSQIHLEGFL